MKHTRRTGWGGLVAAAALVACTPNAESTPKNENASLELGLTAAELEDLEFIAAERGWTRDEAIERIGWERRFDEAIAEIRAAYPDTFAGSAITPEREYQAFVAFKDELPPDVVIHPRLLDLEIDFRGYRGFSEAGLHAQQLDVHHSLRAAGFKELISSYDIEDGWIDVSLAAAHGVTRLDELRPFLPPCGPGV